MARQRIAVVGGVAAGPAAAAEAKRVDPKADVVLFEQGEHISYGACEMPYYIAGWIEDVERLIVLSPAEFERTRGATVRTRREVLSIEPAGERLTYRDLRNGETHEERFEKVILATGARARMPDLSGVDAENVFPLRRLDDAVGLKRYLDSRTVDHAVVFGGGYVGIEAAEALRSRGVRVTILEPAAGLLVNYLEDELRGFVHDTVGRHGVAVRKEAAVALETDREGRVAVVVTDRGGRIGCQLVVVAMGVIPNTGLARDAGARIGDTGALDVDRHMATNLPNVWACGDLVELERVIDGKKIFVPLSPAAFRSARIAARNAAGKGGETLSTFPGVCPASAVRVFDLEVAAVGMRYDQALEAGFDAFTSSVRHLSRVGIYPGAKPIHIRLVVERGAGRLLGAQLVGEEGAALRADVLVPLVREAWRVGDIRDLDLVYAPPLAPSLDPIIVAANEACKKL